ncbi:MAG: group I intron-associated PD-(D/E)XK endonuclease [Litorivicinaceae bacterium]
MLQSKTVGAAGELLFHSRALRQGFDVSLPIGDNSPYDCLVDTGTKIHRIQVKTCASPDGPNSNRYGFSLKRGRDEQTYGTTIDFFALVCLEIDVIYIVPIEDLMNQRTAKTWPTTEGTTGRFEKFREGWGQF